MTNNQYFLVEHPLSLNVEALTENEQVPNHDEFESEIPAPFRMASDLAEIESHHLQVLKLNNETTQALWNYLQAQNLKINTLLSYVLSQQDDKRFHFTSHTFSAGSCLFNAPKGYFSEAQHVRLKIFIPEESAAIYCYARIVNIVPSNTSSAEQEMVELHYQQIREEDRELLIRATLHIQSKQLKARAEQRSAL